jgi:hypothetical protein
LTKCRNCGKLKEQHPTQAPLTKEEKMPEYKLTAAKKNQIASVFFSAPSNQDAILKAVFRILDNARLDPNSCWAIGKVTLSDSKGETISEIPAK